MTLAPVPYDPPEPARNDWITLMRPAAELAVQVAQTEFVPADLRNRPEAVAAAILFGAELGIGPMVALAKIAIVKGRPAPSAELGRALALAAGHDLWIEEAGNTRVVMCGKRRGNTHVFKVTWSMDDAKRAGIASNPAYARYPRQMLVARASAELVRQMCPDVLGGITVFAEEAAELDDTPATNAPPLAPVTPPEPSKKRRRTQTPPNPPAATHDEPAPPPPDGDDKPTKPQTDLAMATFADLGITDRTDRLNATSAILNHPVETWTALTRNDASTVIDALERLKAGTLAFNISEDGNWTSYVIDTDELDDGTGDE